ncbi:MAG: hypothetical protein CO186_08730 [Zetaproteobacteria bacterium CG_4_9_14_3_um_filter_49_83]|nr:MAG: hypothetical protein AUJ56_04275 [Zetaproteobacteria bacterium CG1_02_49_23]PIQ31665.1 MAG: hypothetical protein COW62_09075 [Zetaproteobacteria bacterium CG17_big_fil_post_rev_8_21_14_2_50_50_13]PIV30052.1 MAG: hypothetical protein COS35_08750 [Zetaproteobacteria bacterium CG02_land_8_20_14_3_00_50_9]PIY55531.1 MAG: hypothetical protein COZ00_08980 [Zetaproteobacteria bacterium CG_4_10_14_0_8_um_filter_49_80]PJA34887.1 MAG: hypothetical protein CO186_08730 [Zetaproteobacteria bacterium
MQQNGFVDLRMHHQQQGDEGFWPSFTDIMTVILMIFLLAMLTLLIRNMDLVNQLRQALQAEQQASQALASTSTQNSTLNQKIARLENEVAMMRMQLMDVGDAKVTAEAKLKIAQQELNQFRLAQQQWQLAENALRQQLSVAEQQQVSLKLQNDALQQSFNEKSQDYMQLMQQTGMQKEQLDRLQQEYADLDVKYKKLIRPARSTLGKFVVMVRYQKIDGKLLVEMKEPQENAFREVDAIEMHKQLAALQEKHNKDLYVKIVFPDESGLSYNEAWNLTESLLKMYDYYYQE